MLGRPAGELGTEVDPASLVSFGSEPPAGRGGPPRPAQGRTTTRPGVIEATVTWIDRFGNVQIGADPTALDGIGASAVTPLRITSPVAETGSGEGGAGGGAGPVRARRVDAFEDLDPGELGVLTDSAGRLALVLCRASAAARLHPLGTGDTVLISVDPAGVSGSAPDRPGTS